MPANELLGTYLNDHLAGATGGSELAKKLSSEYAGTRYGDFLTELAQEVEQDRSTLEDLIERLGIEKNPIKEAGAWIMEKVSRVKLSDAVTGNKDLKRLLEFEILSLGVEGKLVMWNALKEVRDQHSELSGTDFDNLAKRAESQRARLEEHRLQAAKAALGS